MSQSGPDNSSLLKALNAATGGSGPAMHQQVYSELLRSRLLVEAAGPPDGEAGKLNIVAIQSADGRTGLAAFTDVASLKLWKAQPAYVAVIPARGLFKMVVEAGFDALVLNPPGLSWELNREELELLGQGRIPQAEPAAVETLYRCEISPPPSAVPDPELARVREALLDYPQITCCYFFTLAMGSDLPGLCLGMRLQGPVEGWQEFLETLKRDAVDLPDVLGQAYRCGPITDEMLPGVERYGTLVFRR